MRMEVTLGFPHALLLLLLAPPLVALALRERRQRARRLAVLGDIGLLERLSPESDPARRLRVRLLAIAGYALLVLALAQPQWGEITEPLPRRGLDVVFALDVSRSMRARDVLPDRLERAKAEIGMLLDRIGENRVGLVAFAGTAFPLCPLTTDVEAARAFLRAASPDVVPQGGTALSAGLEVALNLFLAEAEADPEAAEAGRLLVVVTDGEDHEGGIERVAAALDEAGVELIVIGVGSTLGEPIPVTDVEGRVLGYHKDKKGGTVMTRMAPEVLERVADAASGRFIDGSTRADLGMTDVETALRSLETRQFNASIKRTRIDRSRWPLALGIALLALAVILPERRRAGPRRPAAAPPSRSTSRRAA